MTRSELRFPSPHCQGPRKKSRLPWKNAHPRNASYLNPLESDDHIETPSQGHLWWRILQTSIWRRNLFPRDCSKDRFMNRSCQPSKFRLRKWKRKTTGQKSLVTSCQTTYNLMKTTWEELIQTNLIHLLWLAMLRFPPPCFSTYGWCHQLSLSHPSQKSSELTCHGNGLWQGNPIQQRKTPAHAISMKAKTRFLIQLFGSVMKTARTRSRIHPRNTKTDIVDNNMGCPVNKIVKNEAGAMWPRTQTRSTLSSTRPPVLDIPSLSNAYHPCRGECPRWSYWCLCPAMHATYLWTDVHRSRRPRNLHKVACLTKIPFIANERYPYGPRSQTAYRRGRGWRCQRLVAQPWGTLSLQPINHHAARNSPWLDIWRQDEMPYEHPERFWLTKEKNVAVRNSAARSALFSEEYAAASWEPFHKLTP